MLGRTDHQGRTVVLMLILAVFGSAVVLRLAFWQVQRGPELRVAAMGRLERSTELPAERGRILDRNGRVLALTVYRDRLVAYPRLLVNTADDTLTERDRAGTLAALTDILALDATGQARVGDLLSRGTSEYVVIDRQLTEAQSAAVREELARTGDERRLKAVGLEPQAVRMYPNPGGQPGTTLASHLLGFVTTEGHGAYGIEEQYDALLAGLPTTVAAARDRFGRLLGSSARILEPGRNGSDVRLTIDVGLQLQLEKELLAALHTDGAERVSALIMDPASGAILAWASVPGYDANDYARQWQRDRTAFRDPILSSSYEPGSVMKMFTAAAALEGRRITLGKPVLDTASLSFPPYTVRNADHLAMGWIPFRDVIAYSRNVATARTAAHLARTVPRASAALYRMWTRLGLGRRTGIDLANEEVGIVRDPATHPWAPIDLANRSFGQGVSVTQIQLAAGFTPMINGGYRVTPHFLAATDGQESPRPERERVLSAAVAGQLHSVLDHVTAAVPWYARGSLIRGYQVGGKTGTAQIWMTDKRRYSRDVFNFSFVGYVGGDAPAAVVAVRIQEARVTSREQGDIVMNLTSYQLFNRIARGIIVALDVPRSTFPGAGFPEPLSDADADLTPRRYARHLAQERRGIDLLSVIRDRYSPGGEEREGRGGKRASANGSKRDRQGTRRAGGTEGRSGGRATPAPSADPTGPVTTSPTPSPPTSG